MLVCSVSALTVAYGYNTVLQRGSGESRGHRKGWCTSVDVQQFEEAVSSKYQDGMFGFQREFVVNQFLMYHNVTYIMYYAVNQSTYSHTCPM